MSSHAKPHFCKELQMARPLHRRHRHLRAENEMTLRIEPVQGRLRLSGELRCEHLDQLKAEIERRGSPVVLDLEELSLIDIEAIRFLNECEAKGISTNFPDGFKGLAE